MICTGCSILQIAAYIENLRTSSKFLAWRPERVRCKAKDILHAYVMAERHYTPSELAKLRGAALRRFAAFPARNPVTAYAGITLNKLRSRPSETLNRVQYGKERILVTNYGKKVAQLLPVPEK